MSPEGIDPQEAVYGDTYKPRKGKAMTKSEQEIREMVWRFAKYCNGLSPWKLDDPKDPIIEGSINDFADSIITITEEAKIEELEKLPRAGKTVEQYIKDRIKQLQSKKEVKDE